MGTFIDMLGYKTGFLEVVKLSDKRGNAGQYFWVCKCDCGNHTELATNTLKRGIQKSCGCWKRTGSRELASKTSIANRLARGKTDFDIALSLLYSKYSSSASYRRKNIQFELSREEFTKLVTSNCYYCGAEPSKNHDIKRKYNSPDIKFSGVDRLDSDKDYTTDNCVPCCTFCNRAKNDLSVGDFRAWISNFAKFQDFVNKSVDFKLVN